MDKEKLIKKEIQKGVILYLALAQKTPSDEVTIFLVT